MDDSNPTRQPLAEVQNRPAITRSAPGAIAKSGGRRTQVSTAKLPLPAGSRVLKRPSNLPRASSTLRRQTTQGASAGVKPTDPPLPSRCSAKPKRGLGAASSHAAASRRATTSGTRVSTPMQFTHGAQATRKATVSEAKRSVAEGEALEEIRSHHGLLVQHMLKNSENSVSETKALNCELRQELADLRSQLVNSRSSDDGKYVKMVEEHFELKSKIVEVTAREHQTEFLLTHEKDRVLSLEKEIEQLKATVCALEDGNSVTSDGMKSTENIDALERQLKEANDLREFFESERRRLQGEIAEHKRANESLEIEAGSFTSKLKELQRRHDVAENEIASKESEVRRIRREKDDIELERDEMRATLVKKTALLQEEHAKSEELLSEVQKIHVSREETQKVADEQINCIKSDANSRVEMLSKELNATKQSCRSLEADLENKKLEVTHLQNAVSEQESNISRIRCEAVSLKAKIDALQSEVISKVEEIAFLSKSSNDQGEVILSLEQQAREDASLRKKLHNAIQELKGNIRVFCRVRPMISKENDASHASLARQMFEYNERDQGVIARPPLAEGKTIIQNYPFKFDRVFGPQDGQSVVFEEISQLVQSALDGYRVCIFAYGQTGSGKTHTMLGNRTGNVVDLGMIPRSVRQIFETAKELKKDSWSYKLRASFLEIYNEKVRDLLVNNIANAKDEGFKISFDPISKNSTVSGLTVEDVQNEEQAQRLIEKSMRNRATAATKANERSSRSHSVFRLYIDGQNSTTGQKMSGLLNLVDLAGSERLNQSKAEGERLRETRHINKSLSALGNVIASISNNDKHIPFRDSKLTHLLQDSLGGDCKTLMFVNVSHAIESFNESLCSLRFAAKVNSCHVGTAQRKTKIEF